MSKHTPGVRPASCTVTSIAVISPWPRQLSLSLPPSPYLEPLSKLGEKAQRCALSRINLPYRSAPESQFDSIDYKKRNRPFIPHFSYK